MSGAFRLVAGGLLVTFALGVQATSAGGESSLSDGERAYQKCYACHALEGLDANTQGPSLKGIVGRKVAATPGFAYSPAMRAYSTKQEHWTREALDAFLADPQAVVTDNAMGFFGMSDPQERRALIEYLAGS